MKKACKAALLSASVFPGAGHLYLKRYAIGMVLLAVSLLCLYLLSVPVMNRAMQVVEQIQGGAAAPDVQAMRDLLETMPGGAESLAVNAAAGLLTVCWMFGVVHSYLAGRRRDDDGKER